MSQLRSLLEDVVSAPVEPVDATAIVTRGRKRRRRIIGAQLAAAAALVALVPALLSIAPTSNVPTIEPVAPATTDAGTDPDVDVSTPEQPTPVPARPGDVADPDGDVPEVAPTGS